MGAQGARDVPRHRVAREDPREKTGRRLLAPASTDLRSFPHSSTRVLTDEQLFRSSRQFGSPLLGRALYSFRADGGGSIGYLLRDLDLDLERRRSPATTIKTSPRARSSKRADQAPEGLSAFHAARHKTAPMDYPRAVPVIPRGGGGGA